MTMDYIEKAVDTLIRNDSIIDMPDTSVTSRKIGSSQTRKIPVPQSVLRQNRVLTPDADPAVIRAYKILRTRVLQRMNQNGWTTLGITSPSSNNGKTLTAVNLSISLAKKLDYTVLLIDVDFQQPSLHTYFGLKPEYGLSDHLSGKVKFGELLINPGIERLVILPERGVKETSSELLSSTRMERLIDEVKSRYPSRLVIFDLPPVLVGDDVLAFSGLVDATLLVVEEGRSTDEEVRQAMEQLESANFMGAVLNKSKSHVEGEAYGY
jgi:capsular exopolysaccharide synthesis family protein